MILEFLQLVVSFFFTWVIIFILHEICHKAEAKRQGGDARIEVWFHNRIPSMRVIPYNVSNMMMFYFAGGIYAGLISISFAGILNILGVPILYIPLYILGIVNLFYGVYEGVFITNLPLNKYMKYKNYVYVIGIVIGLLIMSGEIWTYITS